MPRRHVGENDAAGARGGGRGHAHPARGAVSLKAHPPATETPACGAAEHARQAPGSAPHRRVVPRRRDDDRQPVAHLEAELRARQEQRRIARHVERRRDLVGCEHAARTAGKVEAECRAAREAFLGPVGRAGDGAIILGRSGGRDGRPRHRRRHVGDQPRVRLEELDGIHETAVVTPALGHMARVHVAVAIDGAGMDAEVQVGAAIDLGDDGAGGDRLPFLVAQAGDVPVQGPEVLPRRRGVHDDHDPAEAAARAVSAGVGARFPHHAVADRPDSVPDRGRHVLGDVVVGAAAVEPSRPAAERLRTYRPIPEARAGLGCGEQRRDGDGRRLRTGRRLRKHRGDPRAGLRRDRAGRNGRGGERDRENEGEDDRRSAQAPHRA